MKSLRVALLVLVAVAMLSGASLAGDKGKEVTMTGEVLDMFCFMKHPENATGAEHAKCANSCIKRGLPIGFLSDGVVYLIIGNDHKSSAEMVAGMAGRPVQITGVLLEHHGVKSIELTSIKEAGESPEKKEEGKG